MTTKVVVVVTLVAFVAFNCSCYSVRMEPAADVARSWGSGTEILKVVTTAGETIEFEERDPGQVGTGAWVRNGRIEGYVAQPLDMTLAKSQIERTVRSPSGRPVSIWTKEQKSYALESITADTPDSLSFVAVERVLVTVPLSDAYMVSVRRTDTTAPLVIIAGLAVIGVAAAIASNPGPSWSRLNWD